MIDSISEIAIQHADTAMLAHTHGQPATPTTVGKEFTVYVYRLRQSLTNIKSIKTRDKFNGATGNYAAISVALSNKLPRSRMQRDLSDSSSQRNIGLAFGYSLCVSMVFLMLITS